MTALVAEKTETARLVEVFSSIQGKGILAGRRQVIVKRGFKRHPHGLDDPTPVVEFILKHTGTH